MTLQHSTNGKFCWICPGPVLNLGSLGRPLALGWKPLPWIASIPVATTLSSWHTWQVPINIERHSSVLPKRSFTRLHGMRCITLSQRNFIVNIFCDDRPSLSLGSEAVLCATAHGGHWRRVPPCNPFSHLRDVLEFARGKEIGCCCCKVHAPKDEYHCCMHIHTYISRNSSAAPRASTSPHVDVDVDWICATPRCKSR